MDNKTLLKIMCNEDVHSASQLKTPHKGRFSFVHSLKPSASKGLAVFCVVLHESGIRGSNGRYRNEHRARVGAFISINELKA